MEVFIQNIIEQLQYLPDAVVQFFFFISAVLQSTFPPYPGDTVLIFGGYLANSSKAPIANIMLPYLAGTLLSSIALYELAHWKGEQLLSLKLTRKYFPEAKQVKSKETVRKFGAAAIFVCKYIPGLNSAIIIFSGIFHCKRLTSYLGISLAAIIHNVAFYMIGGFIGNNLANIKRFLSIYNKVVIIILLAAILAYASYMLWTFIRKRKLDQL